MTRLAYLLAPAVLLAGCVGPSENREDYRRKAANSAADMMSVIGGGRLTTEPAATDREPIAFVSLRLSESERYAESIITLFSSVQPPPMSSDRLRGELLELVVGGGALAGRLGYAHGEIERPRAVREADEVHRPAHTAGRSFGSRQNVTLFYEADH